MFITRSFKKGLIVEQFHGNYLKHSAIQNKRNEYYRLMHSLIDYMLSSTVYFIESSWALRKGLANRMAICLCCIIYEFVH